MTRFLFLKQLRWALPQWEEQGWVKAEHREAILAHAAAGTGPAVQFLPFALYLMGVLLLGSGVITYVAANWDAMAKLPRLAILLGGLWGCFGVAWFLMRRGSHPYLTEAVLLLAVAVFGANVMLIAQTYHIDSHYPNGVLTWAVGGLLVAFLLRSQTAMIATLALAAVWTTLEAQGFDRAWHLPFLLVWALALGWIVRREWKVAFHAALLALIVWKINQLWPFARTLGGWAYIPQTHFWFVLGLFLVGRAVTRVRRFEKFAEWGALLQIYALPGALFFFYLFTNPEWHQGGYQSLRPPATPAGVWINFLAMGLAAALAAWQFGVEFRQGHRGPVWQGGALLCAALALTGINLFLTEEAAGPVALAANLIFFAALVWMVYRGFMEEERYRINLAFLFFAVTLLSRYFDYFWSLLNRSFFFMAGGLLLLGGGLVLEKFRRRLLAEMTEPASKTSKKERNK